MLLYQKSHDQGFVLIAALLFTLLLSCLVLMLAENSGLTTKSGIYYQQKILTLTDAKKRLLQNEIIFKSGQIPHGAILIDDKICGVKIYHLTTTSKMKFAKTTLQSTYAKLDDVLHCEQKPKIHEGWQSIKEASE